MRHPFRRLLLVALAAAGLAATGPAGAADPPGRVIGIITTADPVAQGMAFVLLGQMRQQGATVEIMLCGAAGDLARREPAGPPAAPLRPMNATPAQMLQSLVRAGVRTEVCALHLPNSDVGQDALIEGVRPAVPPEMARRMMAAGTRVLPF
jgi:predicted peroxiredoxin